MLREHKTLADIIEIYRSLVLPKKAISTQKQQGCQLEHIASVFGYRIADEITTPEICDWHEDKGFDTPYEANRQLALLAHVYSYAVRKGWSKSNPCREVVKHPETPRDRYIEDYEYLALQRHCKQLTCLIMDGSYITGQRRLDVLRIEINDISEDGIKINPSKRGKKILVSTSEQLRAWLSRCYKLSDEMGVKSRYLIHDESGLAIADERFRSDWRRGMKKALLSGELKEPFQFRDIRAKAGTDSDGAQLGHTSRGTLNRHYKRKRIKVKPTI